MAQMPTGTGKTVLLASHLAELLRREWQEWLEGDSEVGRKSKFVTKGYEINLRAKVDKQSMDRAYLSLGTLGGGNHFIAVSYTHLDVYKRQD